MAKGDNQVGEDIAVSPMDRRAKLRLPAQPVPVQTAEKRILNFDPVYLGYDAEQAMLEADRCLQCPEPSACTDACPLSNDIPRAMALIAQGDFEGAANVYRETSNMPEICGRVCPQEVLCEGHCVRNKRGTWVSLGKLEVFVSDYQRRTKGFPKPELPPPSGYSVAIVGSGPAGMTCAEELVKQGHAVTVYEAMPHPGGLLIYGIPAFKLSKAVVDEKVRFLQEIGVKFICNTRIGQDVLVDDLLKEHQAIFLGTGTWVSATMDIPGDDLKGIYQAADFLMQTNAPQEWLPESDSGLDSIGSRVAVIGGGDTAMDCVRSAIRLLSRRGTLDADGSHVTCYYRRTEAEMPGNRRERKMAREEGANFEWLTAPVRFIGDEQGRVQAMECIRMQLGAPDESGRRRPERISGSEFTVEVDAAVLALGYWPDAMLGKTTPDLETRNWGLIVVDEESGGTSRSGVYAGGDNVTGPDLVVTAVVAGRKAAQSISDHLAQLDCQCEQNAVGEPIAVP